MPDDHVIDAPHALDEAIRPQAENPAGLVVEVAEAFNYAAWQNSVPVLHQLHIDNSRGEDLSELVVELAVAPAFARKKRWIIDRIPAGEILRLKDLDLDVDPEYLDRLDEAERGVLTFQLLHGGDVLVDNRQEVRILARDEWGGVSSMAELLPAFVTPNDPALAPVLRSTAEILGSHGHSPALDGYQSRDPGRAYLLAAALWSAVTGRSLVYANPPGSFERVGQKTRRIGTILGDGLATCLDTSLLFASGLEAIGLHPVLVFTQGHCFAGVWLVEKSFRQLVEPDSSELRKAIAAEELVVFETTLVTHRPPAEFPAAVGVATAACAEDKEALFVAVIDVARGRMSQIRPLASHAERSTAGTDETATSPLSLPAVPRFDRLPAQVSEERPQTPSGRIERWQRKLLDLSLRNRLLNFRLSKQTVPVLCPDVSRLEDMLANGNRLRLVSLSEGNPLAGRDAELHQRRTQKDLDWEFARQALDRKELSCPPASRDLDVRLTALFRKVRSDLSEGGSNTLFLAVGFLKWKQSPTDAKSYRAPLLLVPVQLIRRSASSPFYLVNHEDEVQFNATLLQLLKKDFNCRIGEFESRLPMDDSGVDVPRVLDRMRQAVRDIPGFEVVEEAAIAPFSFAKYLMWKDLVDRVSDLEHNRVVHHLIHDPDKAFRPDGVGPIPRPEHLDTRYAPQEIVHPLPADSSQLAAVMAAAEGHDLVIVGPPGTGKSQTIANLIAQCLSMGKTVLFVAEKTAALDVVQRRLKQHGLGDCCIELHSNKAERRRFLDQLEASWKNRSQAEATEWLSVSERLRVRRDQLNAYVAAVHTPEPNGWTAYRALGECVRGRHLAAPRLDWPATVQHDRTAFEMLQSTIASLAATFAALPPQTPPPRMQVADWSLAWESSLLDGCRRLAEAAAALSTAMQGLSGMLGASCLTEASPSHMTPLFRLALELARPRLPHAELLSHESLPALSAAVEVRQGLLQQSAQAQEELDSALRNFCQVLGLSEKPATSPELRRSLYRLANELIRRDLPPAELVFHECFDTLQQRLSERPALERSRRTAFEALEARQYRPALIDRMNAEEVERDWRKAVSAIWPFSGWRISRLTKYLQAHRATSGMADVAIDVPLIGEYGVACRQLKENLAALGLSPTLQALVEKDAAALESRLQSAQRLREVIQATGVAPEDVRHRSPIGWPPLVEAARQLYPPGKRVESLKQQLLQNLTELGLPADLQAEVEQAPESLLPRIESARTIRASLTELGVPPADSADVRHRLLSAEEQRRMDVGNDLCRGLKSFQTAWSDYIRIAGMTPVASSSNSMCADAGAAASRILAQRTHLKKWIAWGQIRTRAEQTGLAGFMSALESGELQPGEAVGRFQLAYARWWLPTVVDRRDPLRMFQRFLHEDAIDDFRRLDELARDLSAPRARQAVFHGLPPSEEVPRKSELGLLRHQLGLKRPSKSIREVIAGMPDAFAKLAPCVLMSPLSIAQYLPAGQSQFDVVVFDEASQIATWDAVGAIARGRQTIIVGDPKQLPPTNFFGRADSDDEDEELDDHEQDLESILDEAQASGLHTLQLNWHYRSRHESLIAFSNWNYYGNHLVTFPAAESIDRGVSLKHIQKGLYDRGKSRTNRQEAEAIAADVVQRMQRCLARPAGQRLTYGVVTFNSQQQELIQDLLDEAQRKHPELEWFFSDDRIEPTAVKNLENVQGDERDVMLFSITFGFDAAGKFPVDFGALNRNGGERRLNVAVTRARQELIVYASFLPDQLRAERSAARGVHDLKAFLEYAQRGPQALLARNVGSQGDPESPLEEAVAQALAERGWRVDSQVGVSGFRIDLGIVHPDRPGAYLAGVECDGATYHRSAAARDRDKTRQQVLQNLGWNIVRIWSIDWWYDPDAALERLDQSLQDLLRQMREEASRASPSVLPVSGSTACRDEGSRPEMREAIREVEETGSAVGPVESDASASRGRESPTEWPSAKAGPIERRTYQRLNLGDASDQQDRFFSEDYTAALREMALAVLASHGPIRDDVLAREVARSHGIARMSSRMKQRVLDLLPDVTCTEESVGRFLWPGSEAAAELAFRYAVDGEDRRSLDEVAMPELIGLVRATPEAATAEDPALALARAIGLARLARSARERLEQALELCQQETPTPPAI